MRARGTNKIVMKTRDIKTGEFSFVVKSEPSTRSLDILGKRSLRDVKNFCQVSHDKFLVELKTEVAGKTYWTLLDSRG